MQVTGIWCRQSCQNPPLAPRGDSQRTAWVEDPGILGASTVHMGRRPVEAPIARAPCLGKRPGLLGAPTCPAPEATRASAALPSLAPSPALHSARLPAGRRGARAGGRGGGTVTLLLVITAVELCCVPATVLGASQQFPATPHVSQVLRTPPGEGRPPPLLRGWELRPERVTCPGPPSWPSAQTALGQAGGLDVAVGRAGGRALTPAGPPSPEEPAWGRSSPGEWGNLSRDFGFYTFFFFLTGIPFTFFKLYFY